MGKSNRCVSRGARAVTYQQGKGKPEIKFVSPWGALGSLGEPWGNKREGEQIILTSGLPREPWRRKAGEPHRDRNGKGNGRKKKGETKRRKRDGMTRKQKRQDAIEKDKQDPTKRTKQSAQQPQP